MEGLSSSTECNLHTTFLQHEVEVFRYNSRSIHYIYITILFNTEQQEIDRNISNLSDICLFLNILSGRVRLTAISIYGEI